jgi:hypothetical protein
MKIIVTPTKRAEKVEYDSMMQKITGLKNKKLTQDELMAFHNHASVIALILMGILFGYLFRDLIKSRYDFYNELWGPAHLLVQGQSPYDTSSLNTNLPAAWFPMAIGFFFPLGWLAEIPALLLWFALGIIGLGMIIYTAQGSKRSLYNTVILGILSFFFPSTLYHYYLGQISIIVTLCLMFAVHFAQKERQWLSSFFVALALSKPHLTLLAILGLSYYYYQGGGFRRMFTFWGRTLAISLVLCIPLFVAYPNWIPDALRSMTQNPIWSYPSLYVLFGRYFNYWGYVLWGCTAIITIWVNYFLWKKLPPSNSMYWSLALAPIASPYVGSWDFVILLPLLILTFVNIDWKRKFIFIVFYVIAWYQMAQIQMLEVSHNHYFWWVPLWFIGIIAILTKWKETASN